MVLLHEIICLLHMHLSEYQQMAEGGWGAVSTGQLERRSGAEWCVWYQLQDQKFHKLREDHVIQRIFKVTVDAQGHNLKGNSFENSTECMICCSLALPAKS